MIRYINPKITDSEVKHIYQLIKTDFGLVAEPFTLHTPSVKLLAAAWMLLRETMLVGYMPRYQKEAVAVAISQLNECPYCVDAHTIMLHADSQHQLAQDLDKQQYNELTAWAINPQQPVPDINHMDEVAATIVAFHYYNRMVHVFLDETPLFNFLSFKSIQRRTVGLSLRQTIKQEKIWGSSLDLLPDEGTLPHALAWAKNNPLLTNTLKRWSHTVEQGGKRVLANETRQLVLSQLAKWSGEPKPLGSNWINEIQVERDLLAETQFVLLVAFAPYRVNASIVDRFRQSHPLDKDIVEAAGWASYVAACRIGELISLS